MKTTILITLILFTQLSMAEEVYYSCKSEAAYEIKDGQKTWTKINGETLDFALFPTGTMIIVDRKHVYTKIKYHRANALAFEQRGPMKMKKGGEHVIGISRIVVDMYTKSYKNTLEGSFSFIAEKDNMQVYELTKLMSCIKLNADQNFLNQAFR